MGKKKKKLLASAPWRGEEEEKGDKFKDAKLRVTNRPGETPTMHVPTKNKPASKRGHGGGDDDDEAEIDPELRYSFQRNFQFLQRVFSIDTVVKPLPPAMAYNASRNLHFFLRIFTQFWGKFLQLIWDIVACGDPEGIADAQKSLGLGQEEKGRRVR